MRIVITVPSVSPTFGGPAAKATGLAEALSRQGFDVTVTGCSAEEGDGGIPTMVGFHGTPFPRSFSSLRELVSAADLIHVLGYRDPIGTFAAIFAVRRGKRLVIEPDGMHRRRLRSLRLKNWFDRTIGSSIMGSADLVVANSGRELGELAVDGAELSRLRLRPNGVSVEELMPLPRRGAFRRAAGIPSRASIVLALGRIAQVKGLVHLVEAVALARGPFLVIAGPDEKDGTLAHLHRSIRDLDIADRVRILERGVWGAEKAQLLADIDCLCMPSMSESFGTSAAEAAAVGRPVIVTDACGVSEVLDPSTCRVVPFGSPPALAEAIGRSLEESSRKTARQRSADVRNELSWSALAGRQVALYEEALASSRPVGGRS